MRTSDLSMDLLMALEGAALEVRRIELLDALLDVTGRPPRGLSGKALLEVARAMVLRRDPIVELLMALGMPATDALVQARLDELRVREQSWALAMWRALESVRGRIGTGASQLSETEASATIASAFWTPGSISRRIANP